MPPEKQKQTTMTTGRASVFTPIAQAQKRLGAKVLLWGPAGVGKSFGALSFPEPIKVLSTEYGVSQLGHHFPGKDIEILECAEAYTDPPVDAAGKEIETPFVTDPLKSLELLDMGVQACRDMTEGTIIIDSVTDVWSWLGAWIKLTAVMHQSKSSGKDYMMRTDWQEANAKYKVILMRLLSRPCNVVFTARSGVVYDGTGNVTAETKPKCQQETPYFMDLVIQMSEAPKVDTKSGMITGNSVRTSTITKCRFADVGSMTIEDLTYDKLKSALKPLVPAEVFG